MIIDYNKEKNEILKETRDISFEEIVEEIKKGENILDIIPHSNQEKYPGQKMLIIKLKNYIYSVPFIESDGKMFLKTIFPDRRLLKKYNIN